MTIFPSLSPSFRLFTPSNDTERYRNDVQVLEDKVYQLQEDVATISLAREKLLEEVTIRTQEYDELLHMKRTDVVRRLDEENIALKVRVGMVMMIIRC